MSNNSKKLKLHIGCGESYIPGWVHVDIADHPHINYKLPAHDLHEIKDESCDLVYASHILEYYDWEDAETIVLPEWNRVLCSGGTLRLALPDFEVHTKLYNAGLPLSYFIGPLYGKMGKEKIYHKSIYDYDTIKELLENTGFMGIERWDWRKVEHSSIDDFSQSYIPHMHKDKGILMSLNVQATKI